MKPAGLLLLALLAAEPRAAAPEYFSQARNVTVSDASRQNYIALDAAVWEHARADLADLRLYDSANKEVPYALVLNGQEQSSAQRPARMFNLVKGPRGTEFLLELDQNEYNRVRLDIAAHDFAGRVSVTATNDLNSGNWVDVGTFPIFDFSREKLGHHSELQLPTLRYRYLRLVLPEPIVPDDVKGASVAAFETRPGTWTELATPEVRQIENKNQLTEVAGILRMEGAFSPATAVIWSQAEHAPLDRVTFEIEGHSNFSRNIELQKLDNQRSDVVASGSISRIHLVRSGEKLDSERLELSTGGVRGKRFVLLIYNGDDPPLPIRAVHSQAIERRLYFDPQGHNGIKLYYGEEKTRAPVYDYAKVFQRDPQATAAALGPEEKNAAYSGRPDDRPWSDRHPVVLWTVLLIAVVGLSAIALRGFIQ